ncbi:MAG: Mfa1 fimbrilin C-terminal domain-containing protein [Muribaculaceae bacterium]|nr:Mfa1 fimbrilin C-terminal domain-containing protein [Muribaculaceae bacterium]
MVSAHFYFYDESGNYVMEANRWTGGATGTEVNVEYIGDNTVILENLTGKNYPSWMVTVLNQPEDFKPGTSLDAMGAIVIDNARRDDGKFIMTTSSYFGDDNKNGQNWNYFATKLNDNNFYQETPDKVQFDEKDRVQVYVERLAVRIGVDIKDIKNTKLEGVQYTENGKSYDLYRVDASVAGDPNDNIGDAAATKLYVAITGWELTTTAKRTNFMKDLTGWNDATTFGGTAWEWNNPDYHRSYWGKSTTYDLSGANLAAALNVSDKTYEDLVQVVGTDVFNGTRLYCNENTNTAANITDNGTVNGNVDPTKTTSILLRAVVCDGTGTPAQIVNYLGLNFEKSNFIAKALQNATTYYTRKPNADKPTFEDGTTNWEYTTLTPEQVKMVSNAAEQGTGSVKLAVADETLEYFILSGTTTTTIEWTDEEGDHSYTQTIPNAIAKTAAQVNEGLAKATEGSSNRAVAYTDGASYYPICIEHLNNPATEGAIVEGQYGVVRNHVYNVRINRVKTLGEGVFVPNSVGGDEAETLTPPVKKPTYYVESNINILSWKVVSQNVEI